MRGMRGLSARGGTLHITKADKVTDEARGQAAEFAARAFAAFALLEPEQLATVSTALGGGDRCSPRQHACGGARQRW